MSISVDVQHWFKFLSRWALFGGLTYLGVLGLFFAIIMPASENSPLPPAHAGEFEFLDLAAAIQNPGLYRLFIAFDVAAWLALGGFFLTLAAIFARRAPIRSTFLAACGLGQLAGVIGAHTRFEVTNLAARYLATPEHQEMLFQSYLDLMLTFTSQFGAGALLWSTALVIAASVSWRVAEFPRWLTVVVGSAGLLMLIKQLTRLLTSVDIAFLFFPALLLLIVTFFGMALVFWRSTPALTSNIQGSVTA